MISFKCTGCGGEMSVDTEGGLFCPYCGTKKFFSDAELQGYRDFRFRMLEYLKTMTDMKAEAADGEYLWNYRETQYLKTADGKDVSIEYLFYAESDGVKIYTAKNSVVYVFSKEDLRKSEHMTAAAGMLEYPSADIKNLSKYFPEIVSRLSLENGGTLIAVRKPENVFPLSAFANLRGEHVAWIVSRLENIACVLEYSELRHGGIDVDSVYINPRTHEAYLLGNWWRLEKKDRKNTDLADIRKTAAVLLGAYRNDIPREFERFLKGSPCGNAYDDFALWDSVIEKGFGGHKFVKFSNT